MRGLAQLLLAVEGSSGRTGLLIIVLPNVSRQSFCAKDSSPALIRYSNASSMAKAVLLVTVMYFELLSIYQVGIALIIPITGTGSWCLHRDCVFKTKRLHLRDIGNDWAARYSSKKMPFLSNAKPTPYLDFRSCHEHDQLFLKAITNNFTGIYHQNHDHLKNNWRGRFA